MYFIEIALFICALRPTFTPQKLLKIGPYALRLVPKLYEMDPCLDVRGPFFWIKRGFYIKVLDSWLTSTY